MFRVSGYSSACMALLALVQVPFPLNVRPVHYRAYVTHCDCWGEVQPLGVSEHASQFATLLEMLNVVAEDKDV